MQRAAFKMQLKPGFEAECRKRHDEVWPELSRALAEAGISDYSIFPDPETLTLFAVQKLADGHAADTLPQHPVVLKWRDHTDWTTPLPSVHHPAADGLTKNPPPPCRAGDDRDGGPRLSSWRVATPIVDAAADDSGVKGVIRLTGNKGHCAGISRANSSSR